MTDVQQPNPDTVADVDQVDGEDSGLDSEMELTGADDAVEESSDSRESRPEPFEHTFGAQAHPAEPAASDPGNVPSASPATTRDDEPKPEEPTPSNPSAAPEQ
jgi:hypothetical protein